MEALQSLSRIPEKYTGFAEGEVSEDGRYVSEEEYWEKYYTHPDFNYEWNNGYPEEKPMADVRGSLIYRWFSRVLLNISDRHNFYQRVRHKAEPAEKRAEHAENQMMPERLRADRLAAKLRELGIEA